MYIEHTLQVNKLIEQENKHSIEVVIQSEGAFQMDKNRKIFYKNI